MEIRRTANAGVLLRLDNISILLDGVCQEMKPYLATPPDEKIQLTACWPDVVAFTHNHEDHYDGVFARAYTEATGKAVVDDAISIGSVKVISVPTCHMGRWRNTTIHKSFVIQGSQNIWFMGDATPTQLKKFSIFPKPDVLIVPFPYVNTPAAIKLLEVYLPCKIVLVHLPSRQYDPDKIWDTIAPGVKQLEQYICLPEMGQTIQL